MQQGYFVGLGSNVNPSENVAAALMRLAAIFGPLEVSRIVETAPEAGLKGRFLNAVIYLRSDLDCSQLKAEFCRIETALGRDRADPDRAHKDRTVDLDILLELPAGVDDIPVEALTNEIYYRPSMLELVKAMGFACSATAEPVWNATEVPFSRQSVGLKPVRVLTGEGGSAGVPVQERRAALVTGAALRLGNAIATVLARSGHDIALHYNTAREAAEEAAQRIRSLGVRCELFQQDLSKIDEIPRLVSDVVNCFPHLDLLVNSASVYDKAKIADTTPEMFDQQWLVNFKAPFFLIREFSSRVERGSIINLLDNKIAFNQFQYAAYLGAKKALAELTKMAALEFAPRIRVNGVAPGVVLPPADRELSYLDWRKQAIPTRTLGDAVHICRAVESLLKNDFMNGQIVFVDGGESINFVGRNLDSYAIESRVSPTRQSASPPTQMLPPQAA